MEHDELPELHEGELPKEAQEFLNNMEGSEYSQHINDLSSRVKGKIVTKAKAGKSGFILLLDDKEWVLSYLVGKEFRWIMGTEKPSVAQLKLMHSESSGDISKPLKVDLPFASESCHHQDEVNRSVGQRIKGVAIGARSFNFCFSKGMELEVLLMSDDQGTLGYRVYWEQW